MKWIKKVILQAFDMVGKFPSFQEKDANSISFLHYMQTSFGDDAYEIYNEVLVGYKLYKAGKDYEPSEVWQRFSSAYSVLADEDSKKTLEKVILFRVIWMIVDSSSIAERLLGINNKNTERNIIKKTLKGFSEYNGKYICGKMVIRTDINVLADVWINENYLLKGICEPHINDVVIDGGAYYGESSIWFSKKVGDAGTVFSFEIIPEYVKVINSNIKENGIRNIHVVDKGLSDKKENSFAVLRGEGSNCREKNGEVLVELTSLDLYFEKELEKKVDYIKLDVEGYELRVLKGAHKVIRMNRPKLAICVYHNFFDICDIPLEIFKMNLGYSIYLRLGTNMLFGTVCFAKS